MRSVLFPAIVSFVLLVATALAAAKPLHIVEKFLGQTTGRFIVKLKDGVSKAEIVRQVAKTGKITHDWEIFNGFAGEIEARALDSLRANPNVESIHEDGVMYTMATQTNAPWGLARLSSTGKLASQDANALNYQYIYPSCAGAGVDIYIVDTGVNINHVEFGGRARWGATFGGYPSVDGSGHGTHCAAIAAGSRYGVAKSAGIVAVKVLSDAGSGSVADIIAGLNWVISDHRATGRPGVISLSLGGGASAALDNAVTACVNAGIYTVVAAGNSNADAGTTSPARAPGAITVGATSIADARASFSNYGAVVDIFAPGQNIISAGGGSNTATSTGSGTSEAAPFVAGLIALLICRDGAVTPAAMETKLKNLCLKGGLTGIPSGTTNCMAHITV